MSPEGPFEILLITADPALHQSIQRCVQDESGVNFRCAPNVEAAAMDLARGRVDALLLDAVGLDRPISHTCRRLETDAPRLPIVVFSGQSRPSAPQPPIPAVVDWLDRAQIDPSLLIRAIRFAVECGRRWNAEQQLNKSMRDLRLAREIQFRLFPLIPPAVEGFDIAGATFSAEMVDGDYYDFIELDDGSVVICVGDACGHGLIASLVMVRTHACLRTLTVMHADLNQMMRQANQVLTNGMSDGRFVTLLLTRLDPATKTLHYANAGHPHGYVLDRHGRACEQMSSTGMPLGIDDKAHFDPSRALTLQRGQLVLMVTDGVKETLTNRGDGFGMERALRIVCQNRHKSADEIIQALHAGIMDLCPDPLIADDITIVVVKCL